MAMKGIRFVLAAAAALLAAGPALAQDQERGDAGKGLAYAEANCAKCHEVRRGHFDSPEPDVPSFEDIAKDEGMSEIALYAFFRTSHRNMPNFVVPPEDIADLTAYLLSIRKHP
jgi:mono/diheme cytochrome c family protein